jgi:hypothetical protein
VDFGDRSVTYARLDVCNGGGRRLDLNGYREIQESDEPLAYQLVNPNLKRQTDDKVHFMSFPTETAETAKTHWYQLAGMGVVTGKKFCYRVERSPWEMILGEG